MKIRAMRSAAWHMLMATDKVTVLVLLLGTYGTLYAEDNNAAGLRVFEFRCEFRMPIASGYVDGLMASKGRRQRIAIYWLEPAMFRDAPSFLRCCDLIFDDDVVYYWIQGMSQPGVLHLSGTEENPLLAVQKSPESILRSALAIVSRIRSSHDETDTPLEVATFFERSRGRIEYKYEVLPGEAGPRPSSNASVSAPELLNALPFGREYSKEIRPQGSMVWRVQKASNGPPVATVTIQRVHGFGQEAARGTFDERTLGQWTLVREAYRAYWSFERALAETVASSEVRTSSRDLYGRLNSYLDQNKVPPEVGRAMNRLRFKAALMTTDSESVWQSARAAVTGLCADEMVPKQQSIMELGSMSGQIQEQYPERIGEQLRPLVARVVRHAGREAPTSANRLMEDITRNGWFTYGDLLLAEMCRVGLMEGREVDLWTAKHQASRSARIVAPTDWSDAPASVRQYLSQLGAVPPRGAMHWNDVRRTLNEGLAKQYTPEQAEIKRETVESVLRCVRLIAGEGPFCGDPEKLIPALDRFSANCLPANNAGGSLESVLATFLALSFCDTSTAQDHEMLSAQLQTCSREVQSYVNARLASHGLASLVTPEDVERRFRRYERLFEQYVDDPLWAPFKFPWTPSEESSLHGTLRLRLTQLESIFEEMSVKVKHGGARAELKEKTTRAISVAAQELLPQAAFLRMPPYPGVGCRYVGGFGFSVAIQGPLYHYRPAEKFKAMKYFHLGHRLQEVVERERELARHEQLQEQTQ